MDRFLPKNPTARSVAIGALAVVALLLVTQIVLPGSPSSPGRGTPLGILFDGFVRGMIISLTAAGIVLIYRTMRILNFAQTAIGVMGANAFFGLILFTEVPFPIAFLLGMFVAAVMGAIVGVVTLRFMRSSRLVLTVVTIVGAGFIVGLSYEVYKLPFFPDYESLTVEQRTGNVALKPFLPFAGWDFEVGSVSQSFGFAHVFAIEASIVCLLALIAFFRYTRAGVAIRALAENPERASLLGIGIGGLTIVVWAIAGVLSGVSTAVTGMVDVPAASGGFSPGILLLAFSAAIVGRMERIPTTVFACIAISVFNRSFEWSFPRDRALIPVLILVVLSVALLLQRKSISRAEQASVSWAATEEQRPIPKVLADITAIRLIRYGFYALALAFVVALPFVGSTALVSLAGVIALASIVVVSIVVLTGWGGQVSLGQWGFAAVGATVGAALTATAGLTFWLAVPLAAAITGGVATLVGLPALRVRGLFLLVVTLAFAFSVESTLFQDRYFGWLRPDKSIERPTLFFFNFRDETSMYFLCVAALVLAIIVVTNLRRSRTGRVLIALRENDANVQAFGVPILRTKLLAFAISGSLAGFAGAIYAHHQQGLNVQGFTAARSIEAFVQAVIGGVGAVTGALLGATYFFLLNYFFKSTLFITVVAAGIPVYLLFTFPGGLISIFNKGRDSVLRIVAQRRQIVVPSLFADYDPEVLENQLIPLSEAETGSGLAALGADQRFVLGSDLYKGRGRRLADRMRGKGRDRGAEALTALGTIASDAPT